MRTRHHAPRLAPLAAILLALGCGGDSSDGGSHDVSVPPDATDTSGGDVGAADADAQPGPDSAADSLDSESDTDLADAVAPDGGAPDVASPDVAQPDVGDPDTGDPDTSEPWKLEATVPLGETLFVDGDDYLYFWATPNDCPVTLLQAPAGAQATIVEGQMRRLTPDVAGTWLLQRCDETATIEVSGDTLNEDTFLNYNYTPTSPLAVVTLDDGEELWTVCPTSNAVQRVFVSGDGGAPGELVPTGSWPSAVVAWPGTDWLLVAQCGRDSLGFVDRTQGRLVDAIEIGDEPANIVLDLDHVAGPRAYVTLSGADQVAIVDLEQRALVRTIDVGYDPRAMAFDAERRLLYVASLQSSNAHPRGPLQEAPVPVEDQRDIAVIDVDTEEVAGWVHSVGTMLRGLWLAPGGDELIVSMSHSNNDKSSINASSKPHSHRLAVVDTAPDSPTRWQVAEEIDLDAQQSSSGPTASPYSMALLPGGGVFVVTLSAGNGLLLLDAATLAELGRVPTGSDPRGLVIAGGRLWTTPWLDNQVASWSLDELETAQDLASLQAETTPIGADPRPERIAAGQRLFNDASFSGQGDFSCNNCHIDGLTDGLVWNLLVDGDVATLPFRNVGGTGPFLWGGVLPTLFDFSREVLKLVGADATGKDMENLTLYMQSVTAPPNPYTLPGGTLTPDGLAGKAIFEAATSAPGGAGCSSCHSGPLLTSQKKVAGKTPGLITDVPSLVGVYDTPPYGRQSSWSTLEAMVAYATVFTGAELDAQQVAQLTAYVRQLPADLLYLSSATPLNSASAAWSLSPVELAFSAVLAPAQADYFHIESDAGPVPGSWATAGRWARFVPDAGELELQTHYTITVSPGLRGNLGQQLNASIKTEFTTGGTPAFDTSGDWRWSVSGAVSGEIDVSFIQGSGGQVSGIVSDGGGLVEVDFVEGFVTGTLLVINPFLVDSSFGQIMTEGVEATLEDTDGDGFADVGKGKIYTPFVDLDVSFTRLGLPGE